MTGPVTPGFVVSIFAGLYGEDGIALLTCGSPRRRAQDT